MENLIDILEQESAEYGHLFELSTKKTPIIVSEDLQQLAEITDEEQRIVNRINHLDNLRNEAVQDMANVLNRDVDTLKIANLIQMLGNRPEEQRKLSIAFDSLRDNAENVARINEQNRELLESALEMVQFNLNILQARKAAPETANYNKGAYSTGDVIGSESKSSFDAKQ